MVRASGIVTAMCESVRVFLRHQSKSSWFIDGRRIAAPVKLSAAGTFSMILTRRSAPGYGSACSSTALTTLKIAVVAPIPSASVSTVTAVNDGVFLRFRNA